MAKKHWIYMKRGLSEDPKHRAQMGECIWLFMHIIDRADWETGVAYDWKDREEAAAMGMPVETLRDQRQKLERLDYIRGLQKQHGQDIKIMEWRNPRDYGSEIKNPRFQSDVEPSPSNSQGDAQGDAQVPSQPVTPTYDSISESDAARSSSSPERGMINPVTGRRTDAKVTGDPVLDMIKFAKRADLWAGREMFRDNHLLYADWWHELTGQPMKGNKKQVTSLQKACLQWQDQGLKIKSLSAAYHARLAWKKFVSDPNEITTDAASLQALSEKEAQLQPETAEPVETPFIEAWNNWTDADKARLEKARAAHRKTKETAV